MKIEVGEVYKCGSEYVYIDSKSTKLEEWGLFSYIGITCGPLGRGVADTYIGRFRHDGDYSSVNTHSLKYPLKELPKRETITIGSAIYYKDEFEAATKHLKIVKGD